MPTPEATYCHACAATRQLLYPLPADPLTTAYQLRKYTKHTVVDPSVRVEFESVRATAYPRPWSARALGVGAIKEGRL
jgi:hypothetical protein